MEPLAALPDETEDFASFRQALRAEHERKIALLEKERNDSLADLIAGRRAYVELRVKEMRLEQECRFTALLEEKRKEGSASVRKALLQHFDSLNHLCGEQIKEKVFSLRKESPEEYASLLLFLVREGLDAAGRPAVISVEPGETSLLSAFGDFLPGEDVKIIEEPLERWGGCRIASGATIIDNTLLSRWKKLSGDFAQKLSLLLNDTFSEIHDRIAQL